MVDGLLPNQGDQMDRDLLEYLLQIGAMRPEEQRNMRLRARAEALRGAKAPEGQMVSGIYVAPSRWQQAAALGAQLGGMFGEYKANKAEEDLMRRRREALDRFIRGPRSTATPDYWSESTGY